MFVSSFVSNPIKPASVNITDTKKTRYMLKCMFWFGKNINKHMVIARRVNTPIPERKTHKANLCLLISAMHINKA